MRKVSLEEGFGERFALFLVFEFVRDLKLAVAFILAMAVVLVIKVLVFAIALKLAEVLILAIALVSEVL